MVEWNIVNGFSKTIKKEFPRLLLLPMALRAVLIGFSSSGIDVLGSSGYKWLLGGYEMDLLSLGKLLQPDLIFRLSALILLRAIPKPEYNTFIQAVGAGSSGQSEFRSLGFSMKLLMKIGMDVIEQQNRDLSETAIFWEILDYWRTKC